MIRICNSLANQGYFVMLVGRRMKGSMILREQAFHQKRLNCWFHRGKAFYIEYNIRLFCYLLFQNIGCICAIDLDTILPCYTVSVIKKVPRVYDAHELFCEMKEIVTRPRIYAAWKKIERFAVPKFRHGYTVNQPIAEEFRRMYDVDYKVVRNFPLLQDISFAEKNEKLILYQGAVNHGRSFETLIPAMRAVDGKLLIFGDGNFLQEAQTLVEQNKLQGKVIFRGKLEPEHLKDVTKTAWIGITLFENNGMSNYLSLANRFSDYVHAAVPQICSAFPVYIELNNKHQVAVLLKDLTPSSIANALNHLLKNDKFHHELVQNCLLAREEWNWQQEEAVLIAFYKNLFEIRG